MQERRWPREVMVMNSVGVSGALSIPEAYRTGDGRLLLLDHVL